MSAEPSAEPRLRKGERTRQHILETALQLFAELGYERTTMRLLAERAGLSLGSFYHYFPGKEHIVQEFYARLGEDVAAAGAEVLARETVLQRRLLGVLRAALDVMQPYHDVAGALFRVAADPGSPLNPFSESSRPVRERSIALMEEVVAGSTDRLPRDVRAELPRMLWLAHMGTVLVWVHDHSPGQERTRAAMEEGVQLIAGLLQVATLPLMRRQRRRLLHLIGVVAGTQLPSDTVAQQ